MNTAQFGKKGWTPERIKDLSVKTFVITGTMQIDNQATLFLAKFTSTCTLDNSFGDDGIATYSAGGGTSGRALAVQSDGKIVVVGDESGVVGHGLGKSKDVASAIAKAVEDAKKNLVRIPLVKGTLPHEQKGKYGGARVNIIPAAAGTGVIAGGAVRTVLEAVGVHDVLSKSQGSSNPHNVVKATFDALLQLRDARRIASDRGISLEKVFNA